MIRAIPWAIALIAATTVARADEATTSTSTRHYGSLSFEPCALGAEGTAQTVEAHCTTLAVPEDHGKPDGRRIELAIAWVPSLRAEAAEDPVFMLAGGPGQGARAGFVRVAPAFRHILRRRHVILVDQRGTGGSNPLVCRDRDGRPAMGEEGDYEPAALAAFAERCREALDADLARYTTSDAVADLDAVRQALGVERISLVGISYGTRVAQTYLRRHPAQVHAAVLDGVVPSELILGSEHARNLEDALALHFERCAEEPLCRERFGSPRATLRELLAELRANPRTVRYRDGLTGEWREDPFDAATLAAVVRLMAYSPSTASMLPMLLHDAAAGREATVMAQARMFTGSLIEEIAHGMQLSVMCTEDAPFLEADPADTETTLGNALIELSLAQCAVWPVGPLPEDFHAPLVSERPVLVLSGALDPVTPPRYGEQVLKGLSNARHLVAPGTGHNVLPAGCASRLVAEFLASADPAALEAECLDELTNTPAFTGYHGWEP